MHHDFSTLQTLPPQWAHVWGEYTLGHDGLGLKLTAPSNYKVVHKNGEMFNNNLGLGASINSTHYMKYGTVKAVVKTSPVAGAITAIIAISPTGDEIDLEWVGGIMIVKHVYDISLFFQFTDSFSQTQKEMDYVFNQTTFTAQMLSMV